MSTRAKYRNGLQTFFDDAQNFETVHKMAPVIYYDDFLAIGALAIPASGSAENGVDWVKKLVQTAGTPTLAGVASAAGGVLAAALDATSEKQESSLTWGDQKGLDVTKGLVWEARIKLSVLPSAAAVQAVWGVSSDWIDGPDNASEYLEFGATGNGAVLCRSQDGTTQTSAAASNAKTLTTADWAICRIDASDVTNVRFYIDGTDVTPAAGVGFAATGANAVLQPYFSVYKASGTGVGTLQVDYVKAWQTR